jgi:hypothetical protein
MCGRALVPSRPVAVGNPLLTGVIGSHSVTTTALRLLIDVEMAAEEAPRRVPLLANHPNQRIGHG